MTGARNAKGGNRGGSRAASVSEAGETSQIEYLLYQSTQGIHFMFENSDIAKIMKHPLAKEEFFTTENMQKVQSMLTAFLNCTSMQEKKSYLERLPEQDFELLVRAYFQLVDNAILAHSSLKH